MSKEERLTELSYQTWQTFLRDMLKLMIDESDGLKLSHYNVERLKKMIDTPYKEAHASLKAYHRREARKILNTISEK